MGTQEIILTDYLMKKDGSNGSVATTSAKGLMSSDDKTKLNEAEVTSNKSSTIDTDTTKYPTNKAVKDFVEQKNYLTSHQDISGKENISNKVKSTDSISSSSTDDQYASAKLIYNTLLKSDSTVKNGHTHDYTSSNDVDTKISTHNSSNVAHSDIRNAIPDVSGKEDTSNKSSTIDTSTTKYPTNNAVKTFVEEKTEPGTFSDLQNIINSATAGSTIVLDKDYKFDSSVDSATGISITKNLTIIGDNHTLDGNNGARIFLIAENSSDVNVNFIDLHFKRGYDSEGYGSAIAHRGLHGALNAFNCVFTNNVGYNGGALYIEEPFINFAIKNCIFNNNSGRDGGAIYITYGIGNISNCTFKNNTASRYGNDIFTPRDPFYIYNCETSSDNLVDVTNKTYLTDHQDISGKLNTSDLANELEDILDDLITEANS